MVSIAAEGLRDDLLELGLDLVDGVAGRQARAVADAEYVRVDREGFLSEGGVEHDIRRLASYAGKRLKLLARARDLPAMIVDQRLAERDDVLRLGVEQANGLDHFA